MRRHGRYGDASTNTYGASQMHHHPHHHMVGQRVEREVAHTFSIKNFKC